MRFNYKFENKKGMKPYKYDNGKIYKISSPHTDKIYIGSTTRCLRERMTEHRNNKVNGITSDKILQHGEGYIELLEDYPCNNKQELFKKEGEFIRENKCLNRCIAGRTIKEYREDNKETKKEYRKEWSEKNKEKIAEYNTEYKKKNKEKILNYNLKRYSDRLLKGETKFINKKITIKFD